MAYKAKAYTLREESTESGIRYFISFKDGQGEHHELEVSEQLFFEFRQMERRNRNLLQWDERHREFNEVWDETLYRRALRVPKSLDESTFISSAGRITVCKDGAGVDFSEELAKKILLEHDITIEIDLDDGTGSAVAWGCDLTYDYVKINGDYRT